MAEQPDHALPIGTPLALAAHVQYDSTPPAGARGPIRLSTWGTFLPLCAWGRRSRGTGAADAWWLPAHHRRGEGMGNLRVLACAGLILSVLGVLAAPRGGVRRRGTMSRLAPRSRSACSPTHVAGTNPRTKGTPNNSIGCSGLRGRGCSSSSSAAPARRARPDRRGPLPLRWTCGVPAGGGYRVPGSAPRAVTLLTLDIGANDVLPCADVRTGRINQPCVEGVDAPPARHLPYILATLREAAGPSVPCPL